MAHPGAWLNALLISSLGLCTEDEMVGIAVGLRFGVSLCRPHDCINCGAVVDEWGTHGLSCRFSKGRHTRHSAINDIIMQSLDSPPALEPVGLYRSDGKRPGQIRSLPVTGAETGCCDTAWECRSSFGLVGGLGLMLFFVFCFFCLCVSFASFVYIIIVCIVSNFVNL